RLQREVETGWTEDVDELVKAWAAGLRRVDWWRRNDGKRWRTAMLGLALAPLGHVGRPWPADVVDERPFKRQRSLLEVVVMMRRHLRRVALAVPRLKIVHHEGRTPEDAPEAAGRRRHVEAVGADAITLGRVRPG